MKIGRILKSDITSGGGTKYDGGRWKVLSDTDKQIELKLVSEGFDNDYEIGDVLIVKKDQWGFEDFGDGSFQFYPNANGVPQYFEIEFEEYLL